MHIHVLIHSIDFTEAGDKLDLVEMVFNQKRYIEHTVKCNTFTVIHSLQI